MDKEKYLQPGELTLVTPEIKAIATSYSSEGLNYAFDVIHWLKENFEIVKFSDKHSHMRTSDQIIKEKTLRGCTDHALVFISLMRAKGIPAKYIEGIQKDWLRTDEKEIRGHILSQIVVNDKKYFVDPTFGIITLKYPGYLEVFGEGLDTYDVGIRSSEELEGKFFEFRKKWQKVHQ